MLISIFFVNGMAFSSPASEIFHAFIPFYFFFLKRVCHLPRMLCNKVVNCLHKHIMGAVYHTINYMSPFLHHFNIFVDNIYYWNSFTKKKKIEIVWFVFYFLLQIESFSFPGTIYFLSSFSTAWETSKEWLCSVCIFWTGYCYVTTSKYSLRNFIVFPYENISTAFFTEQAFAPFAYFRYIFEYKQENGQIEMNWKWQRRWKGRIFIDFFLFYAPNFL